MVEKTAKKQKNYIKRIKPQSGYQMDFLSSEADIVIGGGAAGVGKTFSLLLESLRYTNNRDYGAVIFRRTSPMIRAEGGLWDASTKLYSYISGTEPHKTQLTWKFPSGAKIKFSHLEYEKNIYDWQGSEIVLIGFDELTHFTKTMFFYMLSRNRSTSTIKPYIRATTNPDPDSWVRELIDWWIGDDGFPIPDRNGVIRYFMVDNDNYIWGDTKEEVIKKGWHVIKDMIEKSKVNPDYFVKSLTFISGSIYDNQKLIETDPSYLGNLNALSEEEKNRLLHGNWNIKVTENDIYDYTEFKNIFTNHYLIGEYENAEKWITTDIALKGSDKFIVFVWQGKMLIDFVVMDKSKGNEIIDAIQQMAYKHQVRNSHIIFDNDGVGQFIDGFIDGAIEFNNGARPLNNENYKNLKSQCFFKSGVAVSKGKYYVPPSIANRKYDDKTTLKEQLMRERKAIKRAKPDYDGKLAVIPKQEMKVYLSGKSPDLMDAFGMREYADLEKNEIEVVFY